VASTVRAGVGPFQNDVQARTTAVDGSSVVVAGTGGNVLASSRFTSQTGQLTTGDGVLDDQLRSILETDRYPTATFEQTDAVDLPSARALQAGSQIELHGRLTLHGVTQSVVVPARVSLSGSVMTVDASIPFRLADYGIHGNGFVSVGETGTMSFHLVLTK
jgi:polyisoprenoid-binding protein YceI